MAKEFIFDPEQGSLVPNPEYIFSDEFVPVDEEETYVLEDEETTDVPGGSDSENLQPPDTFAITQTVRNNSDGTTSVDIIVDVTDTVAGQQYEVRVTRL